MMEQSEKTRLEEELEELYNQLQKQALRLNDRLTQAQQSTNLLKGSEYPSPFDSPDSLSEPFMDLLVRYKQAQQRYAQLSVPAPGFSVSEGIPGVKSF
ncbi:hypothetical protein [Spirosoma aerophilum]